MQVLDTQIVSSLKEEMKTDPYIGKFIKLTPILNGTPGERS